MHCRNYGERAWEEVTSGSLIVPALFVGVVSGCGIWSLVNAASDY